MPEGLLVEEEGPFLETPRPERPPYYPTQGEDFLNRLEGAETVGGLESVVLEVLSWREGLTLGCRYYDPEDLDTLSYLEELFTTVEGGRARPESFQVDAKMKEVIEGRIRRIRQRAEKERKSLNEKEREEEKKLTRLLNHVNARILIDAAFRLRWSTCESDEDGASRFQLITRLGQSPKPDSVHWKAALAGDFGEKVDRVLREIIRMGMPPEELKEVGLASVDDVPYTIYAEGFTADTFKPWLRHLIKAANGDMGAVWFAWQLALLWEIPASLGAREVNGAIKIGDPPIVSDLFAKICHCGHKRRADWGVNSRWERIRTSRYSCGQPFSLLPKATETLLDNFLRETTVGKKGGKVSLWDLFWRRGVLLGELPWVAEETKDPRVLDVAEIPRTSFAGWLLRAWKAFSVYKDLTTIPPLSDLGKPTFFTDRAKNWDSVFGEVDEALPPEENPRTLWVLSILYFYSPAPPQRISTTEHGSIRQIMYERGVENPEEFRYKTPNPYDRTASPTTVAGKEPESKEPISLRTILDIAVAAGFLRETDRDFILASLKIRKI